MSRSTLVWGLTLILLGGLLFAQQQGLIQAQVPFWAWLFGGLGVLCLLTWLTNWALWGMVFPGFILLGLGLVIFLSERPTVSGNVVGAVFLASVALPFWIVALRRSNWWAIIPGGVITVLATMPLLAEARLDGQVIGAVFFLGLGATFGLVRLATISQSGMGWVWYPALILGFFGLLVLAGNSPLALPLALIAVGAVLLIRSLLASRTQTPPAKSTEPEAKG
jgi:hypothetical protein